MKEGKQPWRLLKVRLAFFPRERKKKRKKEKQVRIRKEQKDRRAHTLEF